MSSIKENSDFDLCEREKHRPRETSMKVCPAVQACHLSLSGPQGL